MRTMSAHAAKKTKWRVYQNRRVPTPGTNLRMIYDLLMEHRGRVVEITLNKNTKGYMYNILPDMYGLDIRRIGKNRFCLAGEWFGTEYRDYIAEMSDA